MAHPQHDRVDRAAAGADAFRGPGTGGSMAVPGHRLALLLVCLGIDRAHRSGIDAGRSEGLAPVAARRVGLVAGPRAGRLDRLEPERRNRAVCGRAAGSALDLPGRCHVHCPAVVAVPPACRTLAGRLWRVVRTRLAERADPGAGGGVHRLDLAAAVAVGGAVPDGQGRLFPRPVRQRCLHRLGHRHAGRLRRADRAHPASRDADHPPGALRDLPRPAAIAVVHRGAVRAVAAVHRAGAAVGHAFGRQPAAGAGGAADQPGQRGLPARRRHPALPGMAAPAGRGQPAGTADLRRPGAVCDVPAGQPVRLDPLALLGRGGGSADCRLCHRLRLRRTAPAGALAASA